MGWTEAVENAAQAQLISDLKAARGELVARGRCRGDLVDMNGRVCMLGALGVAAIDEFMEMDSGQRENGVGVSLRVQRAETALKTYIGDEVWMFNDSHGTTDQDVLDLFDKTLADLGGLA